MASKDVLPLYRRLLRTKAALLAVSFTLIGVLLIMLNAWLATLSLGDWSWLHHLPLDEIGGPLLGAGLVSTILDYSYRRDQEDVAIQRTQQAIIDLSPAKLWSVLCEGLARHPAELARLTTPERWYDVEARVRLSTAVERSTAGTPLLDVTVEWEYTTVPSGSERRFACVSDRAAYNALVMDTPITTTWLMTPRPGMDAASRRCFELLSFTVDGEDMPIRRTEHEGGQTYIVDASVAAAAGNPVRIRHVYRTVTPAWGHRIYVELPQPARGFSFDLDYTNTSIDSVSVTDMAANGRAAQIVPSPKRAAGRSLSLRAPGWLLSKSGFAIVWTLEDELPQSERSEAA